VRTLWRGEPTRARGGSGEEVEVRIYPRPVQPELPVWLTAIGLESFRLAGERGYNVLSHLLFHDVRELTEKIVTYRQARRAAGHAGTGHVTLMVHTFVGETLEHVRRTVREPLCGYLRSSADLFVKLGLAKRFEVDPTKFSEDDLEAFVDQAFERFFDFNGLLGTVDTCATMIETLRAIGVDEVACLIDFGVDLAAVMQGLERLDRVRLRSNQSPWAAAGAEHVSLSALMRQYGVTHLQCTPAMARMLLAEPDAAESLRSLKRLYVGGDTFPADLARELTRLVGGEVRNMYGPTETTVWSTTARVDAADPVPSIGRPIANTRVYVLDGRLRPVPPGTPGELCIGGEGVARGYWRRPDLTAERFVPDPLTVAEGARLYRTGDLARFRNDGSLEFLGRLDNQLKVRGHRIEPGEIETVLAQHPGVTEAVVVARPDASGEKQLAAFIVPSNGAVAADLLRHFLRKRLPEHMIPSSWTALDAFPLTPNRKIDRRALTIGVPRAENGDEASRRVAALPGSPASARETENECSVRLADALPQRANGGAPARPLTAWRTTTERTLIQLWRGVLETDRAISVYDSFFELGGHSLQAAMLVTRVREMFQIDFSLRDFFAAPDLATLAERIESTAGSSGSRRG
jgi:acyl carrier protein